jgi:hypothetical protein
MQNGLMVVAEKSISNFVINMAEGLMFTISDEQLRSCLEMKEREFICHENQPLKKVDLLPSSCEMDLFRHRTEAGECKYVEVPKQMFWHKLSAGNNWLFSTFKAEKVQVECAGDYNFTTLNGQGVFSLNSGCIARNEEVILVASKNYKRKVKDKLFPNLLPEIKIKNESIKPLHFHHTMLNNAKIIQQIGNKIASMEKTSDENNIHMYSTSYGTLGIVIVALTALGVWRYNKYRIVQQQAPVDFSLAPVRRSVHFSE